MVSPFGLGCCPELLGLCCVSSPALATCKMLLEILFCVSCKNPLFPQPCSPLPFSLVAFAGMPQVRLHCVLTDTRAGGCSTVGGGQVGLPSTRFHVSLRLGGGGSKQQAGDRGWRWEQPSAGGSAQGRGGRWRDRLVPKDRGLHQTPASPPGVHLAGRQNRLRKCV